MQFAETPPKSKKTAQKRQTDSAAFKAIFDSAAIGIALIASDGAVMEVNPYLSNLLGYSADEIRELGVAGISHPDDVAADITSFWRLIAGEVRNYTLEKRYFRKDGSLIWGRLTVSAIPQSKGLPPLCVAMLENTTKQKEAQAAITERISAQEETRRNQKHLRLVIDSLPSLISYIDNNQYYRFANRAYQHWIGDGVHVEGRPVKDVLHDGGYEAVRPYIESALRGEKVEYEQAVKFRDGSERFVHSLYIPDIDDQGAVRGFVVFVTDLTDRRHAEERLRRTEKLAATGRLAATIAHEINNPLEAVTNLLYLAKGDPEISDSGRQFLSRAEGELSRVAHITRQTLGFYRDSVGPVRLSLQDVLEDVLQLYGKKLIQHRIEVVRKFKGDAGITGLSGEVRQVFSNLIANSLDAMPGGGRLTVRVKPVSPRGRGHRDGVRVTIADTGVGIAHEQTRQIFEPFFTTKNDRGTGLGLWLTRNIIQKHGGWIRVRSGTVAGRSGTVFSVFFPRKFQHHEERKVA